MYSMSKDINKLFFIRCPRCNWKELTSGRTADMTHLTEIKKCANCGGKRNFKCPKCGGIAAMKRLARNEDVQG